MGPAANGTYSAVNSDLYDIFFFIELSNSAKDGLDASQKGSAFGSVCTLRQRALYQSGELLFEQFVKKSIFLDGRRVYWQIF